MRTKLLPCGLTAICRANGAIGHRYAEEANKTADLARAAGLEVRIWVPELCGTDYIVVLA